MASPRQLTLVVQIRRKSPRAMAEAWAKVPAARVPSVRFYPLEHFNID